MLFEWHVVSMSPISMMLALIIWLNGFCWASLRSSSFSLCRSSTLVGGMLRLCDCPVLRQTCNLFIRISMASWFPVYSVGVHRSGLKLSQIGQQRAPGRILCPPDMSPCSLSTPLPSGIIGYQNSVLSLPQPWNQPALQGTPVPFSGEWNLKSISG